MKASSFLKVFMALVLAAALAVFAACTIEVHDNSGSGSDSTSGSNSDSTSGSGSDSISGSGSDSSSGGGSEDDTDEGKEEVDVILFTGQSNMVGRETSRYTVDIPEGYAYEYKYLTDGLTELKNPVGETFGQAEVSSGSSIVPQFCADYVEATGRKVIAVHVARGGQEIAKFMQGQTLYNNIVDKYSACLEYLETSGEYSVGHTFYVMFQGESDSLNTSTGKTTSKEQYISNYMNFHDGLQQEFDFEFGAIIYTGRNTNESLAGVKTVNAAQKALAEAESDIIVCDKEPADWYRLHLEYMRSDNVHLNAEGLKRVGSESCKNILNYMGLGESGKKGVDPVTYLEEPVYELTSDASAYEWNFDQGDMSEVNGLRTVTKVGSGNATFTDGKYAHAADGSIVYWELSESLVLSASKDWSMEWKGYSGSPMNGHASVLFSNGANIFITFQESNGIYVRNGNSKAQFNANYISLDDMYSEHVWKLSYSAAEGKIELLQDGVSKGKLAWSSDLQLTHMFGATATYSSSDKNYSFVGSIDYIKISVEK